MTLKNRYDEVMKNVEVTDEMRDRILNNINAVDFEEPPKKVISLSRYKKYLSIAACFILLIAGTLVLYNSFSSQNTPGPPVWETPDVVELDSSEELSGAVWFTVKEPGELPFDVTDVKYTAYWEELADIEYVGTDNTAIFRMAVGNEDISGYYEEFTSVESYIINDCNVTIKGSDDQYILAVWHDDRFSYALQFGEPVSEQEILGAVQSVQ